MNILDVVRENKRKLREIGKEPKYLYCNFVTRKMIEREMKSKMIIGLDACIQFIDGLEIVVDNDVEPLQILIGGEDFHAERQHYIQDQALREMATIPRDAMQ